MSGRWIWSVALMFVAAGALAGRKIDAPVWVYPLSGGAGSAGGAVSSARSSADTNQDIGCTIVAGPGFARNVFCWAHDASTNYGGCSSSDASVVATAANIAGDAWIYFQWDSTGSCTFLQVEQDSSLPPKQL